MSLKHCHAQQIDCSKCPPPEPVAAPDCQGCGDHTAINTLNLMLAIRAFEEHYNLTDAIAHLKTIACLAHQENLLDQFTSNESVLCSKPAHECLTHDDCNLSSCPFGVLANETQLCSLGACVANTTDPTP